VIAAACIRWIVLPPWDSPAQRFGPRTFTGLIHSTYIFADLIWDYFVILAAAHAYEYFTRARNQEVERAELQQALAASELQALKSQLQPHFLFNTLHGISTLIEADKARAKAMVLKLSNLLRTALQYGNSDLITLDEELKFAESYLDIEKMRLSGRLELRWKIQPNTRQLLIPQLILQPLVENAIVHGIACSREGGWLEITSRRSEGLIELNIRNSIRGKDQSGLGLGLRNTKVRLKYLYSDEALFSFVVGEDRVATATLLLPVLETHKPELAEKAAGEQLKSM
jgi:sensor histidine kinase YesM